MDRKRMDLLIETAAFLSFSFCVLLFCLFFLCVTVLSFSFCMLYNVSECSAE